MTNTDVKISCLPQPAFVLFVVFLVLKLTHVISWSWWWVTAPLWGPLVLVFGVFALIAIGAVVFTGTKFDKHSRTYRKMR